MSHALLLAAVTATLRHLLENGLVARGVLANLGSDALITALPPDRIEMGANEKTRLNLFLYQVMPRGLYPFSRSTPDYSPENRYGSAPTLELQYLLTAYGAEDLNAEILLGYALELLHETPVLTGDALQTLLTTMAALPDSRTSYQAVAAMADSGLGSQIEKLTISAQFLTTEQMVSLWSTLHANYRPSLVYKVTLALAE